MICGYVCYVVCYALLRGVLCRGVGYIDQFLLCVVELVMLLCMFSCHVCYVVRHVMARSGQCGDVCDDGLYVMLLCMRCCVVCIVERCAMS